MPKQKTDYEAARVMQDLMNTVVDAYRGETHPSLQAIADELGLNPIKVRKLLITAGAYKSEIADRIMELGKEGRSIEEIMAVTKLSRASVHSYLPYSKMVYKAEEASATAERIRLYRRRKAVIEKLQKDLCFGNLWSCIVLFAGYSFHTAKKLSFTYKIKGNEMFVDRKEKSITRATVELAFMKALELEGNVVGPKRLGCFGASYLYPVFIRLGVIRSVDNKKE